MKVALIAIGSELLNGKIKDLNVHILGKKTREYEFTLEFALTIPDGKLEIISALQMTRHCEAIIITGGLGPTQDDITKSVLIEHFNSQGKEIFNHNGVAKGVYFSLPDQKVFAAPGVPHEFDVMLNQEILPKLGLKSKLDNHLIFKTYRIGEQKIFNELMPDLWEKLSQYGEVSSLPVLSGVNIGIKLLDPNKKEELIQKLNVSKLAPYIWHVGEETLEELIIKTAALKGLKIGCAESCTGGHLSSTLTDVPGASQAFWGSIISYSNDIKIKSLKVDPALIKAHGAVSSQVAKAMAKGAREKLKVDIAVATTGVAGPSGGSERKPVGTVFIGIAGPKGTEAFQYLFKGNRELLKRRFTKAALYRVLGSLKKDF